MFGTHGNCLYEVVEDQLFITRDASSVPTIVRGKSASYIHITEHMQYLPFCNDFGPFDIASIAKFVTLIDTQIRENQSSLIVIRPSQGKAEFTNAVFLCGAYLILKRKCNPMTVSEKFASLDPHEIVAFRDATFSEADFGLTLLDCWRGLDRAVNMGWFSRPSESDDFVWGKYDIEEYLHYQDPLNADLHAVVPDKFVALRGPMDLGHRLYRDSQHFREFSPQYYVDILRELGVSTVIQLNEPCYNGHVFWDHGIAHYDLEFDDCTAPPKHIVDAFFAICDAAPGKVAVHCKAGLGRTGTLIALYLMRRMGFAAREAIAWLRLVRPGSVLGRQQHYLCASEIAAAATAAEGGAEEGAELDESAVVPFEPAGAHNKQTAHAVDCAHRGDLDALLCDECAGAAATARGAERSWGKTKSASHSPSSSHCDPDHVSGLEPATSGVRTGVDSEAGCRAGGQWGERPGDSAEWGAAVPAWVLAEQVALGMRRRSLASIALSRRGASTVTRTAALAAGAGTIQVDE